MLQRIPNVFYIDTKRVTVTLFLDGLPLEPRAQSLAGQAAISRVDGGELTRATRITVAVRAVFRRDIA